MKATESECQFANRKRTAALSPCSAKIGLRNSQAAELSHQDKPKNSKNTKRGGVTYSYPPDESCLPRLACHGAATRLLKVVTEDGKPGGAGVRPRMSRFPGSPKSIPRKDKIR